MRWYDDAMDILHLSLLIYLFLLSSSAPATCQSTGNALVLHIYPKDPTLRVGSNVTVSCTLGNGTDQQPVATTWTNWINSVESHEGAQEEYFITNLTFQRDQYRLIICSYNNLTNRTTIRVQGDVAKPLIKCISLTTKAYKCEWDNEPEANYIFEHRRLRDDRSPGNWIQGTLQKNDTKAWSYIEGTGNQEIRVDATNSVSNASSIITYDVGIHLKPNITYKGSMMTTTSATLSWTTEDTYTGYFSESHVAYEEYDDETKETGERIELNHTIVHGNPATMTIDGLKPGRSYRFYIRSRYVLDGNNFTEWTYVGKNERTKDSRPSDTVQDFESTSKEDDIILTWHHVPKESQNGDILGYNIYVMNESYAEVYNVTETQKKIEGIGYDVRYNICITAYNSAGQSPKDCLTVELNQGPLNEPTVFNDPPNSPDDAFIIVLVVTFVMIFTAVLFCGCRKLTKIFIKWPEPKFTQISFQANFPVPEKEEFDELCPDRNRICPKAMTSSTDQGATGEVTSEVFAEPDYCLKIIESGVYEDVPEEKDELDGPVVYQFVSEKQSDDRPVRSPTSGSDADYIRVGAVEFISSDTSKITRDPPIQNNGYYIMHHKQAPDHGESIPPYTDHGGIAPCSDLGGIAPFPNQGYVAPCSDNGGMAPFSDHGCTAPCSDHPPITKKSFLAHLTKNNNDDYVPMKHGMEINRTAHELTTSDYVGLPPTGLVY